MPSQNIKESVVLLKSIKSSKTELRKAIRRLRIHSGLHKKYYLKLIDVEFILTQFQNEVQDRVDGLQVPTEEDPEATVNLPSTSGQKPEDEKWLKFDFVK